LRNKPIIALGIATDKGLVIIVGCSHVGIVNILDSISEKIGMPIYAVIGGTHLVEADETRIQQEFGDEFIENNTGNTINIDINS